MFFTKLEVPQVFVSSTEDIDRSTNGSINSTRPLTERLFNTRVEQKIPFADDGEAQPFVSSRFAFLMIKVGTSQLR